MTTATDNLVSVGRLADRLGVRVQRVMRVARSLGIAPTLTVDGRALFSASDAASIVTAARSVPQGVGQRCEAGVVSQNAATPQNAASGQEAKGTP
jgi:hypothetical protein